LLVSTHVTKVEVGTILYLVFRFSKNTKEFLMTALQKQTKLDASVN
jgi:hypothetical protein